MVKLKSISCAVMDVRCRIIHDGVRLETSEQPTDADFPWNGNLELDYSIVSDGLVSRPDGKCRDQSLIELDSLQ